VARPSLTAADRARGALLGLAAGASQAGRGRLEGEVVLAILLGEELLEAQPDLHRLVGYWIGWWRRDGQGISPRTALALDHLARLDAPAPPDPGATEGAPLIPVLPVALANATQPRNLQSATYHIVMLTHPDPHAAWSAVAVGIAASQLLLGRRDFLPDVVAGLTANDAPAELLSAVRRIPFIGREELGLGHGVGTGAVACAEAALWTAHHEPVLERGIRALAGPAPDAGPAAAVAGALLGARDGELAIPAEWLAGLKDLERLRDLAKRLLRVET
jgi:ADP-ribosylglycohydrolase